VATSVNLIFTGTPTEPVGSVVNLVFGGMAFAAGTLLGGSAAAPWGRSTDTRSVGATLPWGVAGGAPGGTAGLPWARNDRGRMVQAAAPWGAAGAALGSAPSAPWGLPTGVGAGAAAPWSRSGGFAGGAALPWGASPWAVRGVSLPWAPSSRAGTTVALPWGPAGQVIGSIDPPPPAVVPVPPSSVPQWVNLRFCRPAGTGLALRFGVNPCSGLPAAGTTLIAARRSYLQAHTVTAFRLPDMAVVPLDRFDLSADESAIGWTLSATGPTTLLAQLSPTSGVPARLRVTVDGLVWEFVVEALRENWQFGQRDVTITARSASALLADPYAAEATYLNSVPMTAQQVLQDALQYTGVGLDWRCTDWLVPAGAWSHAGTPMSAVRRVADAIGAVVQSPRVGEAVIVAPRYPALPWEWAAATPDVVLASLDAVLVHGYERSDRPDYEGVYVSGQAQGVLALVKRAGTAPALYMPMVTDPLMTHLDACRQRGGSMLGRAGPAATMTLTLPVLTGSGEPGVIDPGKLVRVVDPAGEWRGLVRSTRVVVDMPLVDQTLTLERHL